MKIPKLYKDNRQYGDTTFRQCQLVGLHLLYVFDEICSRNHLTYFLEGGTALGAIRHKGFIPWDDDVDVGMPIADYRKFLNIARDELPEDVILQTPSDVPTLARTFSKLRDCYSFSYENCSIPCNAQSGIPIDIFPFEDCPNVGEKFRIFICRAAAYSLGHMKIEMGKCMAGMRAMFLHLPLAIVNWIMHSFVRLVWNVLKVILPCNRMSVPIEDSDTRACYYKKDVFPTTKVLFEDGEFPIYRNWDRVLSMHYGDWKMPPPVSQRPVHLSFCDPFRSATGLRYPLGDNQQGRSAAQ